MIRISSKVDYALRAMLELALEYGQKASSIQGIARRQGIPKRFLEHLLLNLKQAGLVVSFRGNVGGYTLAKLPRKIKVGDIIRATEGSLDMAPKGRRGTRTDVVGEVWNALQDAAGNVLDSLSLEDLANKQKRGERILTYNI